MSGVNYISVASVIEQKSESLKYITIPFYQKGVPLSDGKFKKWGMTVFAAGSMRFRWNETNENRNEMLLKIARDNRIKDCPGNCAEPGRSCDCKAKPVSLELIHSQIVYSVKDGTETLQKQGDGMITDNPLLMPVVTVADCVPLFVYDPVKGVFGSVHSGWKGTGIAAQAINLAKQKYNSRPEDFCVILGPHIHDCCYIVNQERADYFTQNFGAECVKPLEEGGNCYCGGRGFPVAWNNGGGPLFRLSLEKANLYSLEKAGVKKENINIINECTCCNERFGSNRRETILNGQPDSFTVQAAFINLQVD